MRETGGSMRSTVLAATMVAALFTLALDLAAPACAKSGRGGGVLPGAKASDPINIDAGKLDYLDKEQKLIYTGSVIVVNGPSTLKVSKLTLFLDNSKNAAPKDANGANTSEKVKHAEFEGPVTLVSPDQICTGDRGSYDRGENKVYLSGNVTITQGDSAHKGDRLIYDLGSGQAVVQSNERVHSIITPKSK